MEQSERKLANEAMEKVVELAKADGCRVYTFESDDRTIRQIFIEDKGGRVGSVSEYYGGIRFSTIHRAHDNSGGSGYGSLVPHRDFNDPEDYKVCFTTYPYWKHNGSKVYKYTSFEDYVNKSLGILKYYEI